MTLVKQVVANPMLCVGLVCARYNITGRGGRVGRSAANLVTLQKVPFANLVTCQLGDFAKNPSGGVIPDRGSHVIFEWGGVLLL